MMNSLRKVKGSAPGLWNRSTAGLLLACSLFQITAAAENIILFIGDGMGFEHVKAARMFNGAALSFEGLPFRGEITTFSANSSVTDSAAAGTALATGVKVNNYVVSMAYPGDNNDLQTSLEFHQLLNKKVGLITTTYLTHATPATFGAHVADRNYTAEIASDYLNFTRPNILFGGGGYGLTPSATASAGYNVATDSAGFGSLTMSPTYRMSAQFGTSYLPYEYDYLGGTYPFPHLSDMVAKALAELAGDPNGFFLMVEGGMIDQACHSNHLERSIHETLEFSRAVQVALTWAAARTDTLILVTADHETGGLTVTKDNGAGNYPTVTWSTTGHTAANVPVYAWGWGAGQVSGVLDNTDIYRICTGQPIPVNLALVPAGATWKYEATGTDLGTTWRQHDYVDSAWPSGRAQLGYGDGDEATVIPKTSPVYPTYYFRHTFTVADPNAYGALSLRVLRDDGAVVYLNGSEVARYNMPTGPITYSTWASTASEYSWDTAVLVPNTLVAGANVLAVEVHQGNSTSSDLSFDLELTAESGEPDQEPPVISNVQVSATATTALVTWTTDEPADSKVDYGLSGEMTGAAGDSVLETQHSVLLIGLLPETTYTYQISSADSRLNTAYTSPATFTTAANRPPVANPDAAVTQRGVAVVIDVLANDTDPDGQALTLSGVTQGTSGTVTIHPDNRVTYQPQPGFTGQDTFTYSVTDGLATVAGTVVVTVSDTVFSDSFESGNFAAGGWAVTGTTAVDPSAAYSGAYGALLKKSSVLTKSLYNVGPGTLTLSYASRVAGLESGEFGVVEFSSDGQIWQPLETLSNASWEEKAVDLTLDASNLHFRFRLNGNDGNDTFMVDKVEVRAGATSNRAPIATADSYTVKQDQTLTVDAPGVLGNDSDPDGDLMMVHLSGAPANGTLTMETNGSFTYTPTAGFIGTDTFTYTVSDGGMESAPATVTITVTAGNSPPVANDDTAITPKGAAITIDVLVNDSDPDGDPLSITAVTQGAAGAVTINSVNGTVTYQPSAAFIGDDWFTYTISDGTATATATVTITVQDAAHTMHISSIVVSAVDLGKGVKRGAAEVIVVDANQQPVVNALVTGAFSGDIQETLTAATDSKGKAVFQTTKTVSGRLRLSFCVENITLSDLTYAPAENVETCDQNY